jgi:hypothetical protein
MVSASKLMIVFGNGPVNVKFLYHWVFGVTKIGKALKLFYAANCAQWISFCVTCELLGCAYPIPVHLYWKAVPSDPNTLFLWKEEKYLIQVVEEVTNDEKYECVMLIDVCKILNIQIGRV